MDKEQIKKALDAFEKDKFTDAKDIISKEIKSKKDAWLQGKLGLKDPIEPVEAETEEE